MAAIELAVSPHPWSEAQFRESLERHAAEVLEIDHCVSGFLVYSRVLDEIELLAIAVAPTFQGDGWGKRLLRHWLASNSGLARSVFLEVRAGNAPAIGLYKSLDFRQVGVRKGYYPASAGREDALLMQLDLER